MSEEEGSGFSATEIDAAVQETYSELLDVNQKLIAKSRRQAARLEEIQQLYIEQAQRCQELIEMHIEGARVIATTIGDILATEWDIQDDEEESSEEDETDEQES